MKRILGLAAGVSLLSGCVHQVMPNETYSMNNYVLVSCSAGGEVKIEHRHVGDKQGVCAAEVSRRIANGHMSRDELAMNMQRVQIDAANEIAEEAAWNAALIHAYY